MGGWGPPQGFDPAGPPSGDAPWPAAPPGLGAGPQAYSTGAISAVERAPRTAWWWFTLAALALMGASAPVGVVIGLRADQAADAEGGWGSLVGLLFGLMIAGAFAVAAGVAGVVAIVRQRRLNERHRPAAPRRPAGVVVCLALASGGGVLALVGMAVAQSVAGA